MLAKMHRHTAGVLAKAVVDHKADLPRFQQFGVRAVKVMSGEDRDLAACGGKGL